MERHPRLVAALLGITCAISDAAVAQDMLEAFRRLDLNSYALGANVLMSSSPYDGVDDFVVVYPAPTRYGSSIETDDTFFIRDGDFGLRTELAGGWDLGGVLSIQTLGYGSGQTPTLAGMKRRNWTILGGFTIGRSFGKIRTDVVARTDLLGEHDGQEFEIKLARVFERGNYYFVPQVDAKYQSSKLVDHYFGVTAGEASPGRPEYRPGGGITYGASLEWGWKWHRNWFVSASAGIDLLPSAVRSSPIVDDEFTFSASVGVSYDAPSMMTLGSPRPSVDSGLEFNFGAFFVDADSKILLTDGSATLPIDLESDFSVRDSEVSVPIDVAWRINAFHRLELGYFELKRNGAGDIVVPVNVGDVPFPAGEIINTSFDTRIFKFGYAFSLLHDAQKELSIFGGAHISDTSFRAAAETGSAAAETTAILPVLGAELQINFTERTSIGAELQFFISDVNRYSGSLIDFGFFGQYAWHDRLTVGAGARFYRQDIDSGDESFFGDYRFEYRGPFVFVKARL